MVIHDGDVRRPGVSPAEDDPPLVIDPDGMPPGETAFQGFEPVAGRHLEVVQLSRLVHLNQLPQGHPGDGLEASILLSPEKLFGIPV